MQCFLISMSCMILNDKLSALSDWKYAQFLKKKKLSAHYSTHTHNCPCEKPVEGKMLLCDSLKAKEGRINKV